MLFAILVTLAVATSLDSLGVGVAFGAGRVHVDAKAHVTISLVMFIVTWLSVALGNEFARALPTWGGKVLGASIFVGLGVWLLAPTFRGTRGRPGGSGSDAPNCADPTGSSDESSAGSVDGSRRVGLREAVLLGGALSLNNFGGGVSAGLMGIGALSMAALSVLFNVLFLVGGHRVGERLARPLMGARMQVASGVLMLLIGLLQLR